MKKQKMGMLKLLGSMIDVNNDALLLLQDYNPAEHGDGISVFDVDHPSAIPVPSLTYELVMGWVNEQNLARTNFYTAREEPDTEAEAAKASPKPTASKKAAQPKRVTNAAVMEQLAALAAQVQLLSARQDAAGVPAPSVPTDPKPQQGGFQIPAVSRGLDQNQGGPQLPMPTASKAPQLAGPPPRTRHGAVPRIAEPQLPPETEVADPVMNPGLPAGATTIENALFQQSTAITSLVAQLASQADPLSDLATTTSASSSTKGVQKREKMQQDLAMGTSGYYLQVMQQLHKRMFPSSPVPKSGDSLAHLSFLQFLEKNGGYKQNRESGLLMWLLGYALDAAAQENMPLVSPSWLWHWISPLWTTATGRWVPAVLSRRPSYSSFSGENHGDQSLRKTVLSLSSAVLDHGGPQLHQRNGDHHHQEGRDVPKEGQEWRSGGGTFYTIAEKEGQVPKEAKGRCTAPRKGGLRRVATKMRLKVPTGDDNAGSALSQAATPPVGPCFSMHAAKGTEDGDRSTTKCSTVSLHVWCAKLYSTPW